MEIRILITGGGTGGHAVPAIAVASAIADRLAGSGNSAVFLYVGSERGVERKLAAEAGIDFVGIATGKLRRSSNPFSMISRANIVDMMRVPVGIAQANREVAKFAPEVVFSTGGYVCVPTVLAAARRHIPIVAHEQTVQIGLANRIVMKRATRVALTYAESEAELPRSARARAIVTGNPVRPIVLGGNAARGRAACGFDAADDSLPTIYITGGAQGSHMINMAVGGALGGLLELSRVVHQCGKQPGADQDFDRLTAIAAKLPESLKRRYYLTQFIGDEIGDVFALADLIVGRSGAGTVSEACAVGKPALFVPLVPTGGDEQTRNARRMADMGAALILPQAKLTGQKLLADLTRLVADRNKLIMMGGAAKSLARPNAAGDLAKLVIETALPGDTIEAQ